MKILVFMLLAVFLLTACAKTTPLSDAVIQTFVGDVTVNAKPAQTGKKIPVGAVVKTGINSTCDILFGGDNAFRMLDNSEITFPDSLTPKKIVLADGGIANVLNNVSSDGNNFMVETKAASLAVRGTVFCIWAESPTNTYMCACNGTIESSGRVIASTNHTAVRITKDGTNITIKTAGLMYHDSALMQSVADDINYKIDWTKIKGSK